MGSTHREGTREHTWVAQPVWLLPTRTLLTTPGHSSRQLFESYPGTSTCIPTPTKVHRQSAFASNWCWQLLPQLPGSWQWAWGSQETGYSGNCSLLVLSFYMTRSNFLLFHRKPMSEWYGKVLSCMAGRTEPCCNTEQQLCAARCHEEPSRPQSLTGFSLPRYSGFAGRALVWLVGRKHHQTNLHSFRSTGCPVLK